MKLSDYLIEKIADSGVQHIFMLPGGGAMHLNDSLGCSKRIQYICNLHEQACSIAAEAYGQYTNNLGVCMVTTGPGSTNALTGVAAAWMDSTPMLVVSGQVKRSDLSHNKGIRQFGFQEINIVPIVESITKYAVTITDPDTVRYHIEKAIWAATSGRPGPSWIDIPLDVQAATIKPSQLLPFCPKDYIYTGTMDDEVLKKHVQETLSELEKSSRPIILVGNGVRLAKCEEDFLKLVQILKVPILTTWKALDLFEEENELFIGRPGAVGQRAANFAQQKSDWLMMLGARMDMGQTAYMHKYLAPKAIKTMIDIDPNEIRKMSTRIEHQIPVDAGEFVQEMLRQLNKCSLNPEMWKTWHKQCLEWKRKYPVVLPEYREFRDGVSVYTLVDVIASLVQENDLVVPGSSGSCSEITMQAFRSKEGVRVLNSEGMGPMGFGISSALGACVASDGRRTVCIDGDGGFAMNTQELETVRRLQLPIKFFVLDNDGYGSIRATQKAYFESRFIGSSEKGGLTLPNLQDIAKAYRIDYFEMNNSREIDRVATLCLERKAATICRVKVSPQQVTAPRVTSRQTDDGSMETAPMDEMWPPL